MISGNIFPVRKCPNHIPFHNQESLVAHLMFMMTSSAQYWVAQLLTVAGGPWGNPNKLLEGVIVEVGCAWDVDLWWGCYYLHMFLQCGNLDIILCSFASGTWSCLAGYHYWKRPCPNVVFETAEWGSRLYQHRGSVVETVCFSNSLYVSNRWEIQTYRLSLMLILPVYFP